MSALPRHTLRGWLLVLAVSLSCGAAFAQGPKRSDHRHHQRWEALDAQERAALRERYRALRELQPETRERRLERAQRLRELIDEVYRGMDPEWRARVDQMEPHERRRYLARLAVEEARKRSREASLVQERMGRIRPGERQGASDRHPGRGPEGRGRDFHRRIVEALEKHVAEQGLPQGLPSEEWQAMLQLEGRDQGRAVRKLVEAHPELRAALPRPRWEKKLDPRQRVLHRSLRLRPEAHWQVQRAPEAQRDQLEWSLRRDQLLRGMAEHPEAFPAEERERVRAMDPTALRAWIREVGLRHGTGFRRGPRGARPERGGPHGDPRHEPGHAPPHGPPGAKGPRPKERSLSPPPHERRRPRNKDRNDHDGR